jgi:hypothetical protein
MTMFDATYWTDLIERTVRTFVQAFGAAALALWIDAGSWGGIDWSLVLQTGVYAGIGAVLFALFSKPVGDTNSASLGR